MNRKIGSSVFVLLTIFFVSSCKNNNVLVVKNTEMNNEFVATYKNLDRRFTLWLPQEDPNPKGMIFMLHGYRETITSFKNKTHMNESAFSKDYAVCYVSSGNEPGWNSGSGISKKDDYGFICSLIKYCQKNYGFSKDSTFLCGFSSGAFMCHYAALQKNPPFCGIIAVAGVAPIKPWEKYKKDFSANLFQIYGTKDDLVLSKKNEKPGVYREYPYIEDVKDTLLKNNNLVPQEVISLSKNCELEKYKNQTRKFWILKIENYPHQWPESRSIDFELSDLIMSFITD